MKRRTPIKIKKSNMMLLEKLMIPALDDFSKYHTESGMIESIKKLINLLRYAEKQKLESFEPTVGGFDMLRRMLDDGTIKMDLYIMLSECIKNPDAPFEIKVINE